MKQNVNGSNWEHPTSDTHILWCLGIFTVMKLISPQRKELNLLFLPPVSPVSSSVFLWLWTLNMLSKIKCFLRQQELLFISHQVKKKKQQASSLTLFVSKTFCLVENTTHIYNYLQNVSSVFSLFSFTSYWSEKPWFEQCKIGDKIYGV